MTGTRSHGLEKQVSADLAERIGHGDAGAEKEFCERYYERLFFFIRKRVGGDAERAKDICQQAFLTALESLRSGKLRNPASLAAYLHGIAVYDVMNDVKRARRRATDVDTDAIERAADTRSSPLDAVSDEQARKGVRKALEGLSATDRRVLIRLYLNDEDRASICASEGYSQAQLNNIVWRAKQRLRKHMLEEAGQTSGDEPALLDLVR